MMRRLSLFVLASVAVYVVALAIGGSGVDSELPAAVALTVNLVAVAATALAARAAGGRRAGRAWSWVSLALASQAVGASIELAARFGGGDLGYPSLADLFYLGFYPLLLLGILTFPTGRRDRPQNMVLALDCAIVALAGGAAFAFFTVGPNAFDDATLSEAAVTGAYPLGDMILIAAVGVVAMTSPPPSLRASLVWITVAVGVFVVGDFFWRSLVLDGDPAGSAALDGAYVVAFACLTGAAASARTDQASTRPPLRTLPAWWLPYVAIALAVAVLILEEAADSVRFPNFAVHTIAAAVFLMLVLRQLISLGELNRSRDQLTQAQALAGLGSFAWDVRADRIEFSEEGARLLGLAYDAQPTLAEVEAMMHPDDRPAHEKAIRRALTEGRPFGIEARLRRGDGVYRIFHTHTQIDLEDGEVVRMHGTHQDVTERRRMEARLEYQANHDPLTGLLNRRRFGDELESALRWTGGHGRGAVLVLGIDQFKAINDALGHGAGDATLKGVAAAIAARARKADAVARLGGDEFGLFLPEADVDRALVTAEDIRAAATRVPNSPRLSVGIATLDQERLIAEEVLVAADLALGDAKRSGRDKVVVYRGQAGGAEGWVDRIRTALKEDRFVLYEQPTIDLTTERLTHHELLIRMISNEGELIAPGDFLPTAERAGLITAIDRWVTAEGLRLARDGRRVSINLSAPTIGDDEILRLVDGALAEGALARNVVFEITETAAIAHMQAARQFVWSLTEMGCGVALDDFGTGFGSFTYLKHLPTTCLKIDREFVRDVADNPTDRAVVRSIAEVAHSLGKQTVAEGVEDEATLRALRSFGVDCAQGYYLGPPVRISPPTRRERELRAAAVEPKGRRRRRGAGPPAPPP